MALKHALAAALATGLASMAIAARLEYFEESLPTTLNPLYATSMADHRAQDRVTRLLREPRAVGARCRGQRHLCHANSKINGL